MDTNSGIVIEGVESWLLVPELAKLLVKIDPGLGAWHLPVQFFTMSKPLETASVNIATFKTARYFGSFDTSHHQLHKGKVCEAVHSSVPFLAVFSSDKISMLCHSS